MKIVIDARTLGQKPSGVGIYTARFARALAQEPDVALCLVTDVCESAEMLSLAEEGIPVLRFGRAIRKGPDLWRYFAFLKRVIREEKPDIFWEVNNLLPIRLKNPYGKYVVTLHDIFPITMPAQHGMIFRLYFRYGLKKTLRCCDALLYNSGTMRREILEHFPAVRTMPQYVGYVITPPPEGEKRERKDYFLYVGNLEKRKGTDLLLEAYSLYRQKGGRSELLLAGKLRDADVQTALERAQRETEGLRYLGYISDSERARRYRECRCLVFPSRAEGFGMPLVEALDSGAGVIASRLPVFEELAGDKVRWFELDGGAEALADKMLDPAPLAPEGWENPFTAEKLGPGLADFFRSLNKKTLCLDGQALMEEVPAGIGTLAAETARSLIRSGRYDVSIRAFSGGRSPAQVEKLRHYGLDEDHIQLCKTLPRGIYLRIWHYLPLPWSLFFPGKADLNLFWNYDVPPGVKGKSLVYVHDMTCLRCPETMDAGVRRLLAQNLADTCRRADKILTLSQFSKNEIVELLGVEPGKIAVVPCGVDHTAFRPLTDPAALARLREKYGVRGEYFLYIGTLEPRKNIALLLKAYERLAAQRPDCPQLVLGGKKGWLYDSLLDTLKTEPLRGKVVFTDYLPREEIPVLMGGALAFVFPSLYEGFGLPPVEAMACGTPVIVSDRASLPEVVGEAGLIVPVETEEALSDAMARLLDEPETRRELSSRSLERAKLYTWENAANCVLAVCDELTIQSP